MSFYYFSFLLCFDIIFPFYFVKAARMNNSRTGQQGTKFHLLLCSNYTAMLVTVMKLITKERVARSVHTSNCTFKSSKWVKVIGVRQTIPNVKNIGFRTYLLVVIRFGSNIWNVLKKKRFLCWWNYSLAAWMIAGERCGSLHDFSVVLLTAVSDTICGKTPLAVRLIVSSRRHACSLCVDDNESCNGQND